MRICLVNTVIFLALLLTTVSAEALKPEVEPGEVIVHWRNPDKRIALSRVAGRSIRRIRDLGHDATLYKLSERTERATMEAIRELKDQPEVAVAEPNFIRRLFTTPIKPNDTNYPLQWNIKAVKLDLAWNRSKGSSNIVVAVIDSGILPNHPDLKGRLLTGRDFIADAANAGDNDGWDGDPTDNGTDALSSSAYHGTHVAGIIGATSNNSKGIVGVDWNCKILPVRALGIQAGKGKDSDIADSIRWAAGVTVTGAPPNTTPAHVINLSFGGPGASTTLTKSVQEAQQKGSIVVAAAGNHGQEGSNIYPAAIPGIITVGATQYDNKRASYSNFGKVVDIMAPGGNMSKNLPFKFNNTDYPAGVLGTLYSSSKKKYTYHFFEGTSQASPLVAGMVSLMLTINGSLNSAETLKILKQTAHTGTTCSEGCGSGLVNADSALAATGGGGPPPGPGTKLPFSSTCVNDSQCNQGVCRSVAGSAKVCTRFCSLDANCPSGSSCTQGLCSPTALNPQNPSNPAQPQGGTVYGGGCEVGWSSSSTANGATGGALLGLLGLFWRRRLRRRSKVQAALPSTSSWY
jgi:serine protease